MRQRLTQQGLFRRTAAPDPFSGRNMNTPINLYDIKPNARFPVGSKVTFVDSRWMKIRGTVLGHAAEDRLWVQWPNETAQMDTEEVVGLDEATERVEVRPSGYVESSRRPRNAAIITFDDLDDREAWRGVNDEYEDEDGDLEFIPDIPDFLNGDPVVTDDHPKNEVHSGELPSEQDPRDKVEEGAGDQGECPESMEVIMSVEPGDMTDLIEGWIASAKRGEPSSRSAQSRWSPPWTQKGKTYNTQKKVQQQQRKLRKQQGELDEATQDILGNNQFEDPKVISFLKQYGLSDQEIQEYAELRAEDLAKAAENYKKTGQPLQWGQGLGGQQQAQPQQAQPQQTLQDVNDEQYNAWVSQQQGQTRPQTQQGGWTPTTQYGKQKKPVPGQPWRPPAPTPTPDWQMGKRTRPPGRGAPIPLGSRSLQGLRQRANLVGGLLAMPRTANVIHETADLISAIHELDDGRSLDDTTRSALRNVSRNLLMATDHLKGVNNRIANRVAGEIEQLYVDALSN